MEWRAQVNDALRRVKSAREREPMVECVFERLDDCIGGSGGGGGAGS